VSEVVVQVYGIDDPDTGKGEPLQLLQVGDFLGFAQTDGVRSTFEEVGVKQSGNVRTLNGTVRDSAGWGSNLDEGFEPIETARTVANELNVDAALARLVANSPSHVPCTKRECAGIARNVNRYRHLRIVSREFVIRWRLVINDL
jgi:hypothetical protein